MKRALIDWRAILDYDPLHGVLRWKVNRPGRRANPGDEAGSVKADGRYRSFVYQGRRYYSHRVAWEIAKGPIPEGMCIDHIDGDGLNNRLKNLRVTTLSGNQRNSRLAKSNRTGVAGVHHHSNGRGYSVYCSNKYVGYFTSIEAACRARKRAEAANGYHKNHGRPRNASDHA